MRTGKRYVGIQRNYEFEVRGGKLRDPLSIIQQPNRSREETLVSRVAMIVRVDCGF